MILTLYTIVEWGYVKAWQTSFSLWVWKKGFIDNLLFVYTDSEHSCGEGFSYALKVTIASSCTLAARDQRIQIIQPDLLAQCWKINYKIKQAKEPLEMHMKAKRQNLARFIYVLSINLSFIYLYPLSIYQLSSKLTHCLGMPILCCLSGFFWIMIYIYPSFYTVFIFILSMANLCWSFIRTLILLEKYRTPKRLGSNKPFALEIRISR